MEEKFDDTLGYWVNFLPYILKSNNDTTITREYLIYDFIYRDFFNNFLEMIDQCDNNSIFNYYKPKLGNINKKELSDTGIKVNGLYINLNNFENFIDYFEYYMNYKQNISKDDISSHIPKYLNIPDVNIENIQDLDFNKLVYPDLSNLKTLFFKRRVTEEEQHKFDLKFEYLTTLIESLRMMKQYNECIFPKIFSTCSFMDNISRERDETTDYILGIKPLPNTMGYSDLADIIVSLDDDDLKIEINTDNDKILKLSEEYRYVCLVVFVNDSDKLTIDNYCDSHRLLILLDNETKKVYNFYGKIYYETFGDNNYIIASEVLKRLNLDNSFSDYIDIIDKNSEKDHLFNIIDIEEINKDNIDNVVMIDWPFWILEVILCNIDKIGNDFIKNSIYSILQKYNIVNYINGLTLKTFSRLETFDFKLNGYLTGSEYNELCKKYL